MKETVLIIACGALAKEIVEIRKLNGWAHIRIQCLPAELHNRPEKIADAVRATIEQYQPQFESIFVAYADCGTGGKLDDVLEELNVERLPGAHCYEFFAGSRIFSELHDAQPGTFYLTDFLVRNFDRLVIRGLGLDRHPELLHDYFGNYKRVVYLAQMPTRELETRAQECAQRLELDYEIEFTGLKPFSEALGFVGQQPFDQESAR